MSSNTDFPSLVEEVDLTRDDLERTALSQKRLPVNTSDTEEEGPKKVLPKECTAYSKCGCPTGPEYCHHFSNDNDRPKIVAGLIADREKIKKDISMNENKLMRLEKEVMDLKDTLRDQWKTWDHKGNVLCKFQTPSRESKPPVQPACPKKRYPDPVETWCQECKLPVHRYKGVITDEGHAECIANWGALHDIDDEEDAWEDWFNNVYTENPRKKSKN
jgi:hypothetical protein